MARYARKSRLHDFCSKKMINTEYILNTLDTILSHSLSDLKTDRKPSGDIPKEKKTSKIDYSILAKA